MINYVAYKKSSFQKLLTIKKDGVLYGGNTFDAELAIVNASGNTVYSATVDNDGFEWTGTGLAKVTVPQAEVNKLDAGVYSYYVRIVSPAVDDDADGLASIVQQGDFEVCEAYKVPTALPTRVY